MGEIVMGDEISCHSIKQHAELGMPPTFADKNNNYSLFCEYSKNNYYICR